MSIAGALAIQGVIFLFVSFVAVLVHSSSFKRNTEKITSVLGWVTLALSMGFFSLAVWTGVAVG